MANLPGGAFAKGRDRIVRVADPGGTRKSCTVESGVITLPSGLVYNFLKGATRAEFTPAPNSQEFFLLGDNGWRDSVGVTQAGELACSAFFINDLDASNEPTDAIDPALQLVLNSESDPDVEIWVEMFTFLGLDSSNNYKYHCRAFQGSIVNVSEAAPSDGLIEYSWTFQSRGEIWAGTYDNSTAALSVYA
tara:strand:+ start:431 stop:1003 length:573 start_codon:yes stop_codon:yes gene_type:complete